MTEEKNRARFTPGPWEARCRTGIDYVISGRDGYVVATTYWRENKEDRYNAALMAQAPAFYADERRNVKFLGGLRDFFTSIVDDQTPPQKDDLDTAAKIWLDEIDRKMSEITELLTKARGEK